MSWDVRVEVCVRVGVCVVTAGVCVSWDVRAEVCVSCVCCENWGVCELGCM